MPSSSSSTNINGYYPFRIFLPANNAESFVYVKEHKGSAANKEKGSNKTLFLTNAPYVTGVRTSLLLKSIFNRFGDVEHVTVVRNARDTAAITSSSNAEDEFLRSSTTDNNTSWLEDYQNDEGKFAHVTFVSREEMKNALRAIYGKEGKKGVVIEEEEVCNLMSQSKALDENTNHTFKPTNCALLNRYKESIIPRTKLMETCNKIMESFQNLEEEERKQKNIDNAKTPDDDGFITVTYKNTSKIGTKTTMETPLLQVAKQSTAVVQHLRKKSNSKRNRTNSKTKLVDGSSELKDFYRFQMRDSRKRNLDDLKHRFEEDLLNVKKMKMMKQYRPF